MAKLRGKIQFEGTLDNLSFYKTQDGIIVRRKWGPDKKRMKRDPSFEGVLNHGKEFGAAAKHSAFLRWTLYEFLKDTADNRVTGRVNKLLLQIIKLDTLSERGDRKLALGLEKAEADALLASFEFNIHQPLSSCLKKVLSIKKHKAQLIIKDVLEKKDLMYPKGATHAELKAGWLRIDFEKRRHILAESNVVLIDRKAATNPILLKTPAIISESGKDLFILKLIFYSKTGKSLQRLEKTNNACNLFNLGK